jgi:hypothetical protein
MGSEADKLEEGTFGAFAHGGDAADRLLGAADAPEAPPDSATPEERPRPVELERNESGGAVLPSQASLSHDPPKRCGPDAGAGQ